MFKLNVDNKNLENVGDVDCPTCENEKCLHMSANKTFSFTTVKSARPAVTFKEQTPTLTLNDAEVTSSFEKKDESWLRKAICFNKKLSPPITVYCKRTGTKKDEITSNMV